MVEQTITIYRGEQVALNFTMNPVVDISGYTLTFTVALQANSSVKKIGPMAATIVSGSAGTFRVVLTEELTNLQPANYFFDVWRTDEGFEQVIASGPFVVKGAARVPPL